MQRLTERLQDGSARYVKSADMLDVLARLADYEDIGPPEPIARIVAAHRDNVKASTPMSMRTNSEFAREIRASWIREIKGARDWNDVDRVHGTIKQMSRATTKN